MSQSQSETSAGPADDQYRLPTSVVPSRYELILEPDLDAGTFAGSEAVAVDVHEPVDEIVVNANELDISEVWLEGPDGSRIDGVVTLDTGAERAHIALATTAAPGPHTLHAAFTGVLNDRLVGFYRSTFVDADGAERVIATTQFEATHARQAFPCWDEPGFKAAFAVTLVVADGLLAISNAAEVSNEPTVDGRRRFRFADTMVMSTYLVAFVVGPLEVTDAVDGGGTPIRLVHVPGKGHLTDFALDVAVKALAYFTSYYGIAYPGDKLDLVAIPDFAFGAMENLGCVTFREVLLLVDTERADQPELERMADVINHELAHMWFGDLVTMKWWNGIWLNEAFATFMELLATDAFRPDWDRWTSFGISRSAAFDTDSLLSTRPIEFPVVSPAEAEGMFDVLTYEKGAAVVRMLEQYLGDEPFRQGIASYLSANSYGNTETTDLWDAIEAATGQPTRRIMDSWIFQGGYPLVSAELVNEGRTLRLSQERFLYDGQDDTRWAIPVLFSTGTADGTRSATPGRYLLDELAVDIPLMTAADWVVVNAGGSGFYRVRYATDLLAALTGPALATLTALERYGLVDDAWASFVAGGTPVDALLHLVRAFADETDVSVWGRIAGVLGSLDRIVDDDDRPALQGFIRALLGPALHRLGADAEPGESDRTTTLRGTLFRALGTLGDDTEIRARAATLHQQHDADPDSVSPALANAAVDVLAVHGDADTFDRFLARSQAADTPQDRLRYLGALADFDDPSQAARFLNLALTDAVRTQDAPFLLRRVIANRANGPAAWTFVRTNWDTINQRFPSNSISRLLEGVRLIYDGAVAADIAAFLTEHPLPQGAKQVAQHLERQRINVGLRERSGGELGQALP